MSERELHVSGPQDFVPIPETLQAQYEKAIAKNIKLLDANQRLMLLVHHIKGRVCGEAHPNWENTERTYSSRVYIADICEIATSVYDGNA